jgi:hypothetical protein
VFEADDEVIGHKQIHNAGSGGTPCASEVAARRRRHAVQRAVSLDIRPWSGPTPSGMTSTPTARWGKALKLHARSNQKLRLSDCSLSFKSGRSGLKIGRVSCHCEGRFDLGQWVRFAQKILKI